MITAKEALAVRNNVEVRMIYITSTIAKLAEKGYTDAYLENPTKEIEEKLKALGYEVYQQDSKEIVISWAKGDTI